MWVSLPVFTDTLLRLIKRLHFPNITFPSPWDCVTCLFQAARFMAVYHVKMQASSGCGSPAICVPPLTLQHLWLVQQLLLTQTSRQTASRGNRKCTEQRVGFPCYLRTPRVQGSDSNPSVRSLGTQELIFSKSAPPSSYYQRTYSLFWGVCPPYVEPSFSRSISTSELGLTASEWSRVMGLHMLISKFDLVDISGLQNLIEQKWEEIISFFVSFSILIGFFLVKIWLIKLCKLIEIKFICLFKKIICSLNAHSGGYSFSCCNCVCSWCRCPNNGTRTPSLCAPQLSLLHTAFPEGFLVTRVQWLHRYQHCWRTWLMCLAQDAVNVAAYLNFFRLLSKLKELGKISSEWN